VNTRIRAEPNAHVYLPLTITKFIFAYDVVRTPAV